MNSFTTLHVCHLCLQLRRVEELRNDVSKLEYSLSAASAEYERIAQVNQQVSMCLLVRCAI